MLRKESLSAEVAGRLRMAMALRQVTHADVGHAVSKAQATVSGWAKGTFLPDVSVLEGVASFLKISSVWLIFGEGKMQAPSAESRASEITESTLEVNS